MKQTCKKILILSLSLLLFSGCSLSHTNKRSDILNFYDPENVTTLNSLTNTNVHDYSYIHAINEGLYAINDEGNIGKGVASKVESANNGKELTFTISKKAKWSNGDNVTANDFVFAWRNIFLSKSPNAYLFGSDGAHIEGADSLLSKKEITQKDIESLGVEAISQRKLKVKLTDNIIVTDYFILPAFYPINENFYNKHKDNYGTGKDNILYNGPFKINTWNKNKSITLVKNKNYHKAKDVSLNTINFTLNSSKDSFISAFKKGEADITYGSTEYYSNYSNRTVYKPLYDNTMWNLAFNMQSQKLKSKNIRKALSYMINQSDLADTLKDRNIASYNLVPTSTYYNSTGNSFVTASQYLKTNNPMRLTKDSLENQYGLDTSKSDDSESKKSKIAKKLIKNNLSLILIYEKNNEKEKAIANHIKESYEKNEKVKVKLISVTDKKTYIQNNSYDLCIYSQTSLLFDAKPYLSNFYSQSEENYSKYSSTEFDKIYNESNNYNLDARFNQLLKLEMSLQTEFVVTPLLQNGYVMIKSDDVVNLYTRPRDIPFTFTHSEIL